MKLSKITTLTSMALLLATSNVLAQESDTSDTDLDATIRVMGAAEAELPEAVTKEIMLPAGVAEDSAAVEASAKGLATANEARLRREAGLQIADDARENAAAEAGENAADAADAARENAEGRSRADDNRPDTPVPPGG